MERATAAIRTEPDARSAIVKAARELFIRDGYDAVSVAQALEAAGVSRGGMYHHFDGKKALLLAVYEEVEGELITAVAAEASQAEGAFGKLEAAADAYLDAAIDSPELRFGLVDVRSILSWAEWRDVAIGLGLGLAIELLRAAIEEGEVQPADPVALGHVVLGAVIEAATWIASSDEPDKVRARAGEAVHRVLQGLRNG